MTDVNKVMLSGIISSEVEIKNIDESPIVYFILSSEFDYKENGQYKTKRNYFEIFAYGTKIARNPNLKKHSPVLVEGQLTRYSYKMDDGKNKKYVVRAINICFL